MVDLRRPWLPRAACKGHVPTRPGQRDIWFPSKGDAETSTREAKRICGLCPVESPCLEWAIATGQGAGIYGGTTPAERSAIRRARGGRRERIAA